MEAKDIIDVFFDDVKNRLAQGEQVILPGIGGFKLKRQYYQRKRRDIPVTEDTPRWQTLTFVPHEDLRARIQRAEIEEERREQVDSKSYEAYQAWLRTQQQD
jgi:integration host factor subunit alpha